MCIKNEIKLYNVILPPYLYCGLPLFVWLEILSSIHLFYWLYQYLFTRKLMVGFTRKIIWKIWFLGFVGDLVGVIFVFVGSQVDYFYIISNDNKNSLGYMIMSGLNNISNHPNDVNIYSYIYISISIFVSSIIIFLLDYFSAFWKSDLTKKQRCLSSLEFAVITAPYIFLLPNSLFYWLVTSWFENTQGKRLFVKKIAFITQTRYERLQWSGRQDLNLRHLGPKPSTLPNWATPRTRQ